MSNLVTLGYGGSFGESFSVSIEEPGRFEVFFKDAGAVYTRVEEPEPMYTSIAEIGAISTVVTSPGVILAMVQDIEQINVYMQIEAIYVNIEEGEE
jgi:hypothetical protein